MKILFLSLGFFSVSLGIIGVILPVLPTTPFLLLATILFSKSSEKADKWLKNTKVYQKHLAEFIEKKSMSRKKKWILLISVDLLLLGVFLSLDSLFLKIILIILFLTKHWYFFRFVKTY